MLILVAKLESKQTTASNKKSTKPAEELDSFQLLGLLAILAFCLANIIGTVPLIELNRFDRKYNRLPYQSTGVVVEGQIVKTRELNRPRVEVNKFTIEYSIDGQDYAFNEEETFSVPYPEFNTGDSIELVILPGNPEKYVVLKKELDDQLDRKFHQRNFRFITLFMGFCAVIGIGSMLVSRIKSPQHDIE